jgi:hypothetical protein
MRGKTPIDLAVEALAGLTEPSLDFALHGARVGPSRHTTATSGLVSPVGEPASTTRAPPPGLGPSQATSRPVLASFSQSAQVFNLFIFY